MSVQDIVALVGAVSGLASLGTLILVLKDRGLGRHESDIRLADTVKELGRQVEGLSAKLAQADAEDSVSTLDRATLNLRVESLEDTVKVAAKESRQTREKVIAMEAANDVAHKSVKEAIVRLEGSVAGLQSQIRLAVTGAADQAIEIRRAGR